MCRRADQGVRGRHIGMLAGIFPYILDIILPDTKNRLVVQFARWPSHRMEVSQRPRIDRPLPAPVPQPGPTNPRLVPPSRRVPVGAGPGPAAGPGRCLLRRPPPATDLSGPAGAGRPPHPARRPGTDRSRPLRRRAGRAPVAPHRRAAQLAPAALPGGHRSRLPQRPARRAQGVLAAAADEHRRLPAGPRSGADQWETLPRGRGARRGEVRAMFEHLAQDPRPITRRDDCALPCSPAPARAAPSWPRWSSRTWSGSRAGVRCGGQGPRPPLRTGRSSGPVSSPRAPSSARARAGRD